MASKNFLKFDRLWLIIAAGCVVLAALRSLAVKFATYKSVLMCVFVVLVTKRRRVIVHIATSADGYIARPDGDLEWLTSRPAPEASMP